MWAWGWARARCVSGSSSDGCRRCRASECGSWWAGGGRGRGIGDRFGPRRGAGGARAGPGRHAVDAREVAGALLGQGLHRPALAQHRVGGPVRQPWASGTFGPRGHGRADGDGGGALARATERVAAGAAREPGGGFARREPARPDGRRSSASAQGRRRPYPHSRAPRGSGGLGPAVRSRRPAAARRALAPAAGRVGTSVIVSLLFLGSWGLSPVVPFVPLPRTARQKKSAHSAPDFPLPATWAEAAGRVNGGGGARGRVT